MGFFCPFIPITTQKTKILKKWKKFLEISSFYICVPKMMIRWYTVPQIWHVTDVIVISHSFWAIFCPFTSLTAQNIKILKKWKKYLEISSCYISVPKLWSDDVWFLRWWHLQIFFSFFQNFDFWVMGDNNPKNQNFEKMKKHLVISSFYICVPKIIIRWCTVSQIWCMMAGQMDGQMNERKKWHIEVGAPPQNIGKCK